MAKHDMGLTNIPEFSVSSLAGALKKTLEESYGHVRVRGELSRVSVAASGHMYSSLKDENATIDAVCWKGVLGKLSVRPEEGLEVVCTGRITTYPARSNYQLIIESMELAGEGALLKMLEARKKKLAAEGLFDVGRKKALPFLPDVIGVVTSPTGAVIRDILHRLEDRMPRHVLVWPVLVQGTQAAAQVAAAIEGFQKIDTCGLRRPDLIIVARGGGSLEDLMPFNEEIVVRAVAASSIPVISAVGHETDTTLCDLAADRRAPTPTAAAEMAVPVRAQILAQVLEAEKRAHNALLRFFEHGRQRVQSAARALRDPLRLLEVKTQGFDHAAGILARVFENVIHRHGARLRLAAGRLRPPATMTQGAQERLARWAENLQPAFAKCLAGYETRLHTLEQILRAYAFENVLARGYVLVRGASGQVITGADQVKMEENLTLQFKGNEFVEAEVRKKY